MQKTTVEIDEKLLEKAMQLSGAKTKKSAIEYGLRELIKSINRNLFKKELGTFNLDLTSEDLDEMRKDG
ncbi:MAG: type II toxin-antitoxin system VapB family antitoxin [Candidatus Aminicenantes bacterium]|nr:MAG: type II toxin-antitoxin system VapB family antitoxin [Candidatus Aminicenantes bacterium]